VDLDEWEEGRENSSGSWFAAIIELSRNSGFPQQGNSVHWLLDPDDHVSRASALALVTARPVTDVSAFADALRSENVQSRRVDSCEGGADSFA
jgi:hypothetical protein